MLLIKIVKFYFNMYTFRFFVIFFIVSTCGFSAHAFYACKDIFAMRSIFLNREVYLPYAESALDGREYRQAALQLFKQDLYEAAIIHSSLSSPLVFIKHSYSHYKALDRALSFLKKQELPLNHWATRTWIVPGATTIAEIPNLPGQFVVGKIDGTLQLVSMNFRHPRLEKTERDELFVWDGRPPHSFVGPKIEKFGDYVFNERERRNSDFFMKSVLGTLHNPAVTVRRNNFEITKNPQAIISLFVTKDGVAWYRNMSSEIHSVNLIELFNPKDAN
jgi:hypothetical protein